MPRHLRTPKRKITSLHKSPAGLSAKAEAWVNSTLRKMSLEEKAGQLVTVQFFGGEFLNEDSPEFRELSHQVEDNKVGAMMVATRTGPLGLELSRAYPAAGLVNILQHRARTPLLVAADFERGTGMRLADGTSFPHSMAIAAGGRLEDAYEMGRITALEARAVGVNWIFAPVADVNSDPSNPIINIRSFGEEPKSVAEWVTSYIRGVEENGALATAKHFPGHGETNIDSHLAMPTIPSGREHIENVELVPFRAAIAAGVSTIMTAHLAVPALESQDDMPATFSERITTGLLRRKLRFGGLIVTDDLSMGGVAGRYPTGETAVRSILAGADMLLVFAEVDAAVAALREAARSGRIPIARLDEAVKRILQAKAKVGLDTGKTRADLNALPKRFRRTEFAQAAQEIADRGVTLLRDLPKSLPLDATKPLRVLLAIVAGDPDRMPGAALEQELRGRVDSLQIVRADTRFQTIDRVTLPPSDSYDIALIALVVRITNAKNSIGLPAEQAAFVRRMLTSRKPAIVASFGSPYLISNFREARTWLASFSTADVIQRAAIRALFGQIPIAGKIPVTLPGVIACGTGMQLPANPMKLLASDEMERQLAPAYEVLKCATSEKAFPGGVMAVGHCNEFAVHAVGKHAYDSNAPAVTVGTIYDAASLTKPVVTTTLAAMLAELGQMDLDAPVARYLLEWDTRSTNSSRARVTIRHLLTHTSGLPAYEKYFLSARDRNELVSKACAEELASEPGAQSVYSDIGFILLGEIIERLTGASLDRLARERIFTPLGMNRSFFNPAKSIRKHIAPTEHDKTFRKHLICGEVHDENAWAMGGIAGHAGLFSTAGDLAIFCQMLLNGGIYAHHRVLHRQTIAQFTAPSSLAANERTMGWNKPTTNSSSGHYFSPTSFGHLGYTGTSIWIDPQKQLFVVLLTNRVHPTGENDKIQQVRPAIHDAIVKALGLQQ